MKQTAFNMLLAVLVLFASMLPQQHATAAAAQLPQQTRTQAGCDCLNEWVDAAGVQHAGAGCINPDTNPRGTWCAVDPRACPGYYGSFVGSSGAAVFYDFCGDVRERTASGCLCAPEWRLDAGPGKSAYYDRCASPDAPDQRKCRVDLATCPPAVAEPPAALDACAPLTGDAATGAPAAATGPLAATSTYHGCPCVPGWQYEYPVPSSSGGNSSTNAPPSATTATSAGCANPDGDPLGAWCAVDPDACGRFAGYASAGPARALAFDYCAARAPSLAPRQGCGGASAARIPAYAQCGGKSACTEWGCADEPWAGVCCGAGLACRRLDAFYWQCQPASSTGDSTSSINATSSSANANATTQQPEGTVQLLSANVDVSALPSLQAAAPGAAARVRVRIDRQWSSVKDDAGAQARLKSDLVAWLRATSGAAAEHIYSAGIDALYEGSIVAEGAVVFTADAPADAATTAATRLSGDAAAQAYAGSNLASTWGPLLSAEAAAAPNELAAAAAAAPAAAQTGADGGRVQLSPGAIAGIVIGATAAVGLLAALVVATAMRAQRGRDRDKAAQLAYLNELTDADIAAADAADDADSKSAAGGVTVEMIPGDGRRRRAAGAPKLPASSAATLRRSSSSSGDGGGGGNRGGSAAAYDLTANAAAGTTAAAAVVAPRAPPPGRKLLAAAAAAAASVGPEPAMLPLPDGEAARRSSGGGSGVAFASLKQRHISSGGGGGGAAASPAAAAGAGATMMMSGGPASSGLQQQQQHVPLPGSPVLRTSGAAGSGAFASGAALLSRIGVSIGPEPAPGKDQ